MKNRIQSNFKGPLRLFLFIVCSLFGIVKSNAQLVQVGTGTTTQNGTGLTPYSTVYEDAKVQYIILK